MSNRDCRHGHLARSCEQCNMEAELAHLRPVHEAARETLRRFWALEYYEARTVEDALQPLRAALSAERVPECQMDGFCLLPAGHDGQHSAERVPTPITDKVEPWTDADQARIDREYEARRKRVPTPITDEGLYRTEMERALAAHEGVLIERVQTLEAELDRARAALDAALNGGKR